MRSVAVYEPLKPVIASWSLEYPECTAVIFFQESGNQVRVIGSRSWDFAALHECFADIDSTMPWKKAAKNILPPVDDGGVWCNLFSEADLKSEYAPLFSELAVVSATRELIPLLSVDMAPRDWEHEENNMDLVDSLNSYGADPMKNRSNTFSANASHSRSVYLSRALEIFAAWRYIAPKGTGRNPNKHAFDVWEKERRRLAG